MNKRKYMALL